MNKRRCPICKSRKWRENQLERGKWKCFNKKCGFEWWNPAYHVSKSDGGITSKGFESQTITNSSLFKQIHDLHNNAYKFKIIRDNPDLELPRIKGFDGRIYIINYKGFKARKTKKWLIIYKSGRNKVPLKDLDKTGLLVLEGMRNLALEMSHKYGFEISPIPLPFSKNRPEVKTPFLSANNFYEEEAKAVYKPLPSPIEMQGKNAINNSINLSTALAELNQSILLEIHNKKLHRNVLNDMKDTLKLIQESNSQKSLNKPSFFKRLKSIFWRI